MPTAETYNFAQNSPESPGNGPETGGFGENKQLRPRAGCHPKPWHRRAKFGTGPRRPLDREQRARFRFLARAHARAGHLPAKAEWVAHALLKRLGEDGQCDPAHATLAEDAGCSVSTVRRALAQLASLGLVRWGMRLIRNGWRAEQTSNAYELIPTAPAPVSPGVRCGVQYGRPIISKIFLTAKILGGNDEWGRWNRDRQLSALAEASK